MGPSLRRARGRGGERTEEASENHWTPFAHRSPLPAKILQLECIYKSFASTRLRCCRFDLYAHHSRPGHTILDGGKEIWKPPPGCNGERSSTLHCRRVLIRLDVRRSSAGYRGARCFVSLFRSGRHASLHGRDKEIFAQRDEKLAAARLRRSLRRRQQAERDTSCWTECAGLEDRVQLVGTLVVRHAMAQR